MRIHIFCFSLLCITASALYVAEVPKEAPRDFTPLANQPENVLATIVSNLSETDLTRFGSVSPRLHDIAQAELETRAGYLWKNGDLITTPSFHAHEGPVHAVFVTNDGSIVSVGHSDRHIRVWKWNGTTFSKIKEMVDGVPSDIAFARFSLASNRLVLVHKNTVISTWDIQTEQVLKQFRTSPINNLMQVSPDGKTVAISRGNIIVLLDPITLSRKEINTGFHEAIWSIAFSRDGKYLAASTTQNDPVKGWNLKTSEESEFPLTEGRLYLSFLPDGKLIGYLVGFDLKFWDVRTGKQIRSWKSQGSVLGIKTLANHSDLLAAQLPMGIGIYYIRSGKELRKLATTPPANFAFSPDDKMLVAGLKNGDIVTWKVQKKATKSTK